MTNWDDYYTWGEPQEETDRRDCFVRIRLFEGIQDVERVLYHLQNGEVEGLKFYYTNTCVIVHVCGTEWEREYPFANYGFSFSAVEFDLKTNGFTEKAKSLNKFLKEPFL